MNRVEEYVRGGMLCAFYLVESDIGLSATADIWLDAQLMCKIAQHRHLKDRAAALAALREGCDAWISEWKSRQAK